MCGFINATKKQTKQQAGPDLQAPLVFVVGLFKELFALRSITARLWVVWNNHIVDVVDIPSKRGRIWGESCQSNSSRVSNNTYISL